MFLLHFLVYYYFATTNTNHIFTENHHSCETEVQHRVNVPSFKLTFLLGSLLLLLTYPFSSAANHSVMIKRALWLSRKQPMCLTSQCSALASWLMALLGKRIRAAQPCANWTYRRWFPTDSRWNVFWGVYQENVSFGRFFPMHFMHVRRFTALNVWV